MDMFALTNPYDETTKLCHALKQYQADVYEAVTFIITRTTYVAPDFENQSRDPVGGKLGSGKKKGNKSRLISYPSPNCALTPTNKNPKSYIPY